MSILKDYLFNWRWWLGLKPKFALMPARDYTITVVIPAYNEQATIAQTIESIKKQTIGISEIIVVNDSSTDKTAEVANQCGAKVITTPTNQGTKAMAQNYALPYVSTELVVTIDADTILHPEAIKKTLPYFNDKRTASVCGFVIPQKIQTIWERGRFVEYVFGISLFKAAQNNMGAVLVSSGCFSVFRTDLLNTMGGFKSRTMAEDMDLTWEFAIAGYRVYCVQDSFCYPLDPPTGKIFISQIDRWTRSYFQNVSIHSFRKNLKLGLFVYYYLLEAMLMPLILMTGLAVWSKVNLGSLLYAIPLAVALDLLIVSIPCLIKGIQIGQAGLILSSLPAYVMIRPVNFYIFWRSLYKEWIKKERLSSWNKGH